MKKFMLLIMAVGALTFTSCSSDDDGGSSSKSCEQLGQDVVSALQDYNTDFSKEHCIAYKKALRALISKKCTGAAQYESSLDDLNCDDME